jgi:hypothetical protein
VLLSDAPIPPVSRGLGKAILRRQLGIESIGLDVSIQTSVMKFEVSNAGLGARRSSIISRKNRLSMECPARCERARRRDGVWRIFQ